MDTQSPLISSSHYLAQPRWQRVGTSPVWWPVSTGAELPCKYPRFTRFITSLAVKFATSSMEHIGEAQTETERERDRSASSGGVGTLAQQNGCRAVASCTQTPSMLGEWWPALITQKQVSCRRESGLYLASSGRAGVAEAKGCTQGRWSYGLDFASASTCKGS